MSKQYEYAIKYISSEVFPTERTMKFPSYEEAMDMVTFLHNQGATELEIIRREVSDWKPIHQSGLPDEISAV